MTKGELRKARKLARENGQTFTGELALDKGNEPCEFSPERNKNGTYNLKRARALDRYARFCYEHDRD